MKVFISLRQPNVYKCFYFCHDLGVLKNEKIDEIN